MRALGALSSLGVTVSNVLYVAVTIVVFALLFLLVIGMTIVIFALFFLLVRAVEHLER